MRRSPEDLLAPRNLQRKIKNKNNDKDKDKDECLRLKLSLRLTFAILANDNAFVFGHKIDQPIVHQYLETRLFLAAEFLEDSALISGFKVA